ncbi:tRNA (adenosine(37)-N6)-threonylcarbamoyltransferase complex dimerization subunit type 1 TsaB [Psychromicrobium xiongbiense]|uniref:tRNA (adenosine(37)-N6)-threonylcarbamoyltransferase complex dimerization subunit type 1 TsaB n=1 Tax=Psychromicrobium xiongbiense TaxID=3051184 RepID=UPI002554E7DD|nr:tRNA (adenosine(37)-N6)-threonylcarbamoyltransferase complex dimerization subunit type 1 TsaB [Psychromicrobium sp. YIM S02556]
MLLALDTSAIASAALLDDDAPSVEEGQADDGTSRLVASFSSPDTRRHAEVLASAVADLVDAHGRPDRIVVGVGPGPFTGLRVGIAAARTLAFVWQIPLYGLRSLDALAWDATRSNSRGDGDFLVATDARRKEVYWARYTAVGRLVAGPFVAAASELPADLPVYGAGAGLYAEQLGSRDVPEFAQAQPQAASLGQVAAQILRRHNASHVNGHNANSNASHDAADSPWAPLLDTTPLYLRGSDAQVPGPRKRVS